MEDVHPKVVHMEENRAGNKPMDIKNIYNIKKEDVIVQEYINKSSNSTINMYHKDQVNIYIENSDLNKKTYNCYTCNIQIYNYSFFRYHFKSEWHKYNLKRKLLNLKAVNEVTFNEKVHNLTKGENHACGNNPLSGDPPSSNHCAHKKHSNGKKKKEKKNHAELCSRKKANNGSSYTSNNCEAQKIKYATKEDVLMTKNVKYDNPLVCFFDNRIFNSVEENIKHMNDNYTFYIPDLKYVTNLKKVLLTIGKKIYEENICVYCFRHSKCVKSLQSHMICKSHTKLHSEFFIFIQKYYDFSKSYVDLLNRYITNKEDKELLLCLLQKKRNNQIESKCHRSSERSVEEEAQQKQREEHPTTGCVQTAREDRSDVRPSNAEEAKPQLDNEYKSESDNSSDDYKVKEEELSKNINYDTIYEVLEQFGYIKPELNEYNNLVLPDGSEAINRKIAYIFKQKLPLENRATSKCEKLDVLKKRESNQDYRRYRAYIDVMKKYNLDLNVKTNGLNKFYKSDSIFFL
ncbi:hypothetical protein C922_04564 [Plasmodium inui San Antonio 1]|uniref:ZN622/Rei1/Reh1 zinc finger C2H2-type domain-containing protein n=1 Tax=Plasmodium inui San Antonio 1 TaxID=1237626 RepID=W7A169_9APIC|nr:hypothetical protein C922_04564 [Plasmodium inui San Antonio 1]EUD65053.1 hypothetical protein C922_04564 [Plasmodium inui San Antonio 1]